MHTGIAAVNSNNKVGITVLLWTLKKEKDVNFWMILYTLNRYYFSNQKNTDCWCRECWLIDIKNVNCQSHQCLKTKQIKSLTIYFTFCPRILLKNPIFCVGKDAFGYSAIFVKIRSLFSTFRNTYPEWKMLLTSSSSNKC